MKLILSPSGSFLTGTEIADALMGYAIALIKHRDVALVDIPVLDARGRIQRWALVIGWRIDTSSMSADARPEGEVVDVDTTVRLNDRAESVGAVRGEPFTWEDLSENDWTRADQDFES